MKRNYCDICLKEDDDLVHIDILVHIKNKNPLEGHVKMIDGNMVSFSGRSERTECCMVCYNKVMYPLWDSIQKLKQ
jgi:hypothetical protein